MHEAGHALVAFLSEHADPVAKITILPAGRALGVTEQLPVDERHLYPESYLLDSLAVRLGGRASEILVLGEASTGAANDLSGATQLALRMVKEWGLSPRLGPIGYGSDGPAYLSGPQFGQERPFAEGTQQVIDEEVTRLLREAEDTAHSLLSDNSAALQAVIGALLEKETISGGDFVEIVRRAQQSKNGSGATRQVSWVVTASRPGDTAIHQAARPVRSMVRLNPERVEERRTNDAIGCHLGKEA